MTSNQLDILAGAITLCHMRIIELNSYEEMMNEYKRVRKEISILNEELESEPIQEEN